MTPAYTQTPRLLAVTTPLGADVLLLTAFTGEEALSQPFRYHLEMLSTKETIAAKDIVGKAVTWVVQGKDRDPCYFNGIVKSFAAAGAHVRDLRRYRAEVVPWLWFLSRNANCRIFQNKTAPQIIEQIFNDRGFSDFEKSLKGSYVKREYCVQYRETDLQFVSRLMEQEGIFYYFRHENGKHTLVLADQKSAYKDAAEKEVDYAAGAHLSGHITRWDHQYEFRSGKWTQTDYNFETPTTSLLTDSSTVVQLTDNQKFELFDYPGLYQKKSDGTGLTKIRMEEEEAPYEVVSGAATCTSFSPGFKFKLKTHDWEGEAGKSYVITGIRHSAKDTSYNLQEAQDQEYKNTFTCIPAATTFRPARTTPRPTVQGPQTAVVVGPSGEEIYTDKYGRVKVQFFWDREGKKDENSSCWIRVAQNWAGKNWGIVFHPRIGQEVVVDFLEGDPDRPLITGRVYNADQMPPYELPANQTQSVLKTRSSKNGSTDNFNELRFEDKKGSEDIFFHAEKDFHREVENNDNLKVGSDKADDGSQTIEIYKNRTETIKTGDEKVTLEKGQRTHQVQKDDTLKVIDGGRTITVKKDHALTVQQGNASIKVSQGNYELSVTQGNITIKASAGKIAAEAMQGIELKVGQNSIKIDQSGVTIQGMTVKVNGQVSSEINGAMTKVQASAMLQAKGGVTMLG
jgi:type VI secretion system secreted protein VgrG